MHLVDVGVQDDESSIPISYLYITMPLGAQAPIQVRRTVWTFRYGQLLPFCGWVG